MPFDENKFYIEAIDLWRACDGVYECPKTADGTRTGPLVGYTGTYTTRSGAEENYVGEIYYDFAMVEQYAAALDRFATILALGIRQDKPTVLLGAPLGGLWLTAAVGRQLAVRQVFAEKKVVALGDEHQREKSVVVLGRHRIYPGDRVVVIEDVCNNFSTTKQLIALVEDAGGTVVSIGCALNRSPMNCYHPASRLEHFPVRPVIHLEIPEYQQGDLYVAEDVAAGNVIWKPKIEWNRLVEAMNV